MPASQARRATPASPPKRSVIIKRRARSIGSAWKSCRTAERMPWFRLWRWRISSAAMTKRFDRRAPVILATSNDASWTSSRRAGRRCSAAMSCSAMVVVLPASPTTFVVTVIAQSARDSRAKWLAVRQADLLPVPYFHVVFTVPAPVGEIAFQNKAAVGAILFRTAAETLATIAADRRHLGAKLGVTMVLYTWGVHCIVPGGGPSLWRHPLGRLSPGFFLPGACALAAVPPAVLAGAQERLRGRQAAVLRQSRQSCRTVGLRTSPRRTSAPRCRSPGALRRFSGHYPIEPCPSHRPQAPAFLNHSPALAKSCRRIAADAAWKLQKSAAGGR